MLRSLEFYATISKLGILVNANVFLDVFLFYAWNTSTKSTKVHTTLHSLRQTRRYSHCFSSTFLSNAFLGFVPETRSRTVSHLEMNERHTEQGTRYLRNISSVPLSDEESKENHFSSQATTSAEQDFCSSNQAARSSIDDSSSTRSAQVSSDQHDKDTEPPQSSSDSIPSAATIRANKIKAIVSINKRRNETIWWRKYGPWFEYRNEMLLMLLVKNPKRFPRVTFKLIDDETSEMDVDIPEEQPGDEKFEPKYMKMKPTTDYWWL